MTDWIKWNGGECPIKSDKTKVEYKLRSNSTYSANGQYLRWTDTKNEYDIIAYRITEDHEKMDYDASPIHTHKMTREQITAQINALQKQLDAMPKPIRMYWNGGNNCGFQNPSDTHTFDIETINGIPHIHGVAMKEVGK